MRPAVSGVTSFLGNSRNFTISNPKIISINRTKPFDTVYTTQGRTVVDDETDSRSTRMTKVDLTKVRLKTMMRPGEERITGDKKLKRLKGAGYIRLDAKIFQTLWENQSLIPESWKEEEEFIGQRFICFDGTVFQMEGYRCCLYLLWWDKKWNWGFLWYALYQRADHPSAVLEK
jgi:hypothetical protein